MAREPELHKWKLREGYRAETDPPPGLVPQAVIDTSEDLAERVAALEARVLELETLMLPHLGMKAADQRGKL